MVDPEETKKLYLAIGEAVVVFQQIEQWISQALSMMIKIRHREDAQLIAASMSYGQKLDLMMELYPTRRPEQFAQIDLNILRRALSAAEDYRNRIVHSFWAVECGDDKNRWVRIRGSLRGRKGFKLHSVAADTEMLNECNRALREILGWWHSDSGRLLAALETIERSFRAGVDVAGVSGGKS